MKKLHIKDAIILCIITLISGLLLGFVNNLTKEPIKKAKLAAKYEAYKSVFENAEDFNMNDELNISINEINEKLKKENFGKVKIDSVVEALDKNGKPEGYVVDTSSMDGYGGNISISVGINNDNIINSIAFLSIQETPGLGMKATEEPFYSQFNNKKANILSVVKGNSKSDDEISAISGATISSRAVTNAVNAAIYFVNNKK